VLLGTVAVLILARAGFTAAGHLPTADGGASGVRLPVHGTAVIWPQRGQAAFVLGDGRLHASPHEQPAPIASLAKVMTAYLTLERYPLSAGQEGFTVTVTEAEAQSAADDAARGQSVVAVRAGEELTERRLLEALLVPSGNNIAQLLSEVVAGGEPGFVEAMNAEARSLAMEHTVYTDPSGFDPDTVSTAADQLRVLRRAMRFAAFRAIVSMAAVTLPVAGTLHNFNPLVADGYAGKTGSDSAAGGCLAFFTRLTDGGRRLIAAGVVMGQGEGSNTSAILAAAAEAAEQLVESAVRADLR
jgi:D-alanyl-D-alanine carboxypeptidase (penicillin-binding protein 5/6)